MGSYGPTVDHAHRSGTAGTHGMVSVAVRSALVAVTLGAFAPALVHAQAGPPAAAAAPGNVLEEITVTARKKDETALSVPVAITAFSEANLEKLNINSFTDYATKTPNMAFSYGTANWGYVDSHSIAIRGISGFGTTGVYIDDTPVPDSLDPRVVDIARIEVLKGPQGTLFGQSSLGGNLRLITVQPTPGKDDIHYTARIGGTSGAGSPDYGLDFAGTQRLGSDNLLLRAVGFYDHAGGFIHRVAVDPNTGQSLANVNNYGAQKTYGGSLSLRWIASDNLDIGLRFMAQNSESDGWSAPYAPNPPFAIQNFVMNRSNDVQERARDRFYLPALTVEYKGSGYQIHESLSYFDRRATQVEDDSEGTRDVFILDWAYAPSTLDPTMFPYANIANLTALNSPFAWQEVINYRRTVSETRLSFDKTSFGLSGVTGIYLSRSFSDTRLNGGANPLVSQLGLNTDQASTDLNAFFYGTTTPQSYCRTVVGDTSCKSYGSNRVWDSWQPSYHKDAALFGELYYEFANFELTVGGRYYRQTQTGYEYAAGAFNFSELNIPVPDTKQTGFNPKLALKYNFDPSTMVYASFSKGFRAGGAGVPLPGAPASFLHAIHQQLNTPTTYDSDYVKNYELGGKVELAGGKVVLTGAVFQMDWSNIQQTIIAPVSDITLIVNAGDARVRGGELELDARPVTGVDLHAGVGYSDATITKQVLYWQEAGSRVYNVPKVTANASATFTVPLSSGLSTFLTVDGSYVGDSVSGTMGCQLNTATLTAFPCPPLAAGQAHADPLTRSGYKLLNARLGLSWERSEIALFANNISGERPNLGDFNPEGYARHSTDPAQYVPAYGAGFVIPRVATLRPFSAGITFRQRF
jgi:iron complex outermembrane recepter protein